MVGSDAFNLMNYAYMVSPTRLELAVYRVCVYISGEFVRFYSMSVAKVARSISREFCVLHILDNIFG